MRDVKGIRAVPKWLSINILIMTLAFSVSAIGGLSEQDSLAWSVLAGAVAVVASLVAGVTVAAFVGLASLLFIPLSLLAITTKLDAIVAYMLIISVIFVLAMSIVRAREDVRFFVRRGFILLAGVVATPPCALWLYANTHHVYAVILIAFVLILTHLFWPVCWEEYPELNRGLV